jgi:signal transduction histidine kinase
MQETMEKLRAANTELKNAQAQLVQSEKMASLGLLVAGIAHEINTPVGAIHSMHDTMVRAVEKLKSTLTMCGLASTEAERVGPIFKAIDDANRVIDSGTERVTTIVRRLRSFARLDEAELKAVDIHEGIEDTLMLIHHEIKKRITVLRDFGEVPPLTCYPGRLNQVHLNLLNNARQAIDGKGQITIKTSVRDSRVCIQYTDTGSGISAKNLDRIFDPGFTTKGVRVGAGLGLSICYQIIEDHRGKIEVESKVGEGTTFTILLPLDLKEQLQNESGERESPPSA